MDLDGKSCKDFVVNDVVDLTWFFHQGHFPEEHSFVDVAPIHEQPRDRFWFQDFD